MTGFEALWFEAAKGLAGLAIKTAGDMAKVPLDKPAQQLFFRASQQYIQNYNERHGILKVLGMREPIPLESVYVAVQCLDETGLRGYGSIEALEQAYRESKKRQFRFEKPPKQPGINIANDKQYLMVLAGPGMGKSTFLRKMGLEALKGARKDGFQHPCIPVFVELKLFRSGEIDIQGAITKEFETCGFPDYERFTKVMLEKGRLLILLDGLDEVPTDRMSEAITRIQDFVDRYNKNRFVASCRVAAYRHNFRRFTDIAIADFDDDQIQSFIQNWFQKQPERGQECWEKLASSEYTAAKELTHTPLLLTLACLLYQRAGQFPTNRATLYERALRVLLEEWAGEKELPQDHLYKGLDTKRKELLLSEIAHNAFQEDRLFLSKRELVQQIEPLLKEMLPDEKFIDGNAVLRSIEVQHGILVERAEGIYSFSHLTLQEFLTAQHIVEETQLVERLVADHLSSDRWEEVFLLLAGLKKADQLLLQMHQQAQTYLTPKLKELLHWANQITDGSEKESNTAAKRAIAIFLALEHACDIVRDIERTLALDLDDVLNIEQDLELELECALNLVWDITHALEPLSIRDFLFKRGYKRIRFSDGIRIRRLEHEFEFSSALERSHIFQGTNLKGLIAKFEVLKIKERDQTFSGVEKSRLSETLQKLWMDALNIHRDLVTLSPDDANALNTYLAANLLIVECKKAAVRVSPATWAAIESKMLLP